MLACLATIEPLDTATGTRTTIRVSSVNDRANGALVNGLNGQVWEPAMVEAPVLGLTLWNGDFTAAVAPAGASLPLKMETVKGTYPTADALAWIGAPVSIYAQEAGTAWPWTARFKGRVRGYQRKGQTLTLNAEVDLEPLNANILTAVYAGTGGAEGGADLKNRVKPLAIGWPKNVEPVPIDTVNNVHQFSAYGAIEAVTTLFERGSDFGASQGDYATYAALVAATIPAGKWGTCLAAGMIRLGAPAFGVITADIKGHKVGATTPRLTGAVISALATIAGVSTGDIDTASLTALDAAAARSINLVLTAQETWFDRARALALACNYQAGASLTGKFFVAAVSLGGSAVLELEAQGRRSPQVVQSDEVDVSVPYWRTVLGANRAWRVHSADEIAFAAELVERGLYSGATTYREGNVVNLADGSRWVYINAAATSGNAPPTWPTTSNTWWSALTGPTNAIWSATVNDNGTKPSDYAGTTNTFIAFATGGGTGSRQGNVLTKLTGGSGWNFGFYSAEAVRGNGIITARPAAANRTCMVLLTPVASRTTPITGQGIFFNSDGNAYFWNNGNAGLIGAYDATTTVTGIFDGVEWRFFRDGAAFGATFATATYATSDLVCQTNFELDATTLNAVQFYPNTANNFAAQGGATKPADNATVGARAGTNIFRTDGTTILSQADIRTIEGTAALITGQAATATSSDFGAVTGATKPENSASIDANIVGNNPIIIFAEATGAPKTGELDKLVPYKLFRLGSALTSGVTWSASLISGNATFSVSGTGTGTLTITGPNNATLAVESIIRLTGSYLSIARTLDVKVIRQDDPPTSSGGGSGNPGTSASTTSLGNTVGTTFPGTASATMTCKAGTAGQVACTFPGSYKRNTTSAVGSTTATGKWQWRAVAGSWADIDAGDTGSAAESINEPPFFNNAGTGAFDATKTGLTSGTDYEFQFLWHRTTVTGTAVEVYRSAGTLMVTGS